MSQLLEPREVEPGAWKRWLKTSARLSLRLWLSALPLVLAIGLCVGWGLRETNYVAGLVLLPLTGLWQVLLLSLAERAAAGKRVTVGDAWDGVVAFCRQSPDVVWEQIKSRVLLALGLLAVAGAIHGVIFVVRWATDAGAIPPVPAQPDPSLFMELSSMASCWALFWMWTWGAQMGGVLSGMQTLVRKHGMDWNAAGKLWNQALRKNGRSLFPLIMGGVLMSYILLFITPLSLLVFPFEVFWTCLIAVVMRDMFEKKDALDPQEARESVAAKAPSWVA